MFPKLFLSFRRITNFNVALNLCGRSNLLLTYRGLRTKTYPAMKETSIDSFGPQLQAFVREKVELCQPDSIHICDGSREENDMLLNEMIESKMMKRLPLYKDW